MKKITFLITFFIVSLGYSQNDLLLGFENGESGGIDGGPFGGLASATIVAGEGSNTTQVLEIVANDGAEVWQGINLNLTDNVELTSTKSMSMDVYSDTPIVFLVKVNDGVAGAQEAAAQVLYPGGATWQTLTFTFDTSLDNKAEMANGEYNGFVVHAYWSDGATLFSDVSKDMRTFYIDNITGVAAQEATPTCSDNIQNGDETGVDCGGSCEPCEQAAAPTVAAPAQPARNAEDVVSLFSGAYDDIAITTWSTNWDNSSYEDVQIAGDDVKKIAFEGFLGVEFANEVDLSAFTHFHMDYWTTDNINAGQVLNVKLSNHGGLPDASGETNAVLLTNPVTTSGAWVTVDVPLSEFAVVAGDSDAIDKVFQFVLDVGATLDDVYVDNLYFYKGEALSNNNFDLNKVSAYPNPANNAWNITAKSNISEITVFNILGEQVLQLQPNDVNAKIDSASLNSGMYLAKIKSENSEQTIKLIKQ